MADDKDKNTTKEQEERRNRFLWGDGDIMIENPTKKKTDAKKDETKK
jgi:hypothetical protein